MNDFSAMHQDDGGENSIAAVAARIQERANEVASERAAVELAKAQLQELQTLLKNERKMNDTIRRIMLSTVRSRHGVEMELCKIRDEQEERLFNVEQYQRETQEAVEEMEQVHDVWEDTVRDVYVEHDLQRELYRRSVHGRIKRREQHMKERDQKLHQLAQETKIFEEETKRMEEETKQLEKNIIDLDSREEKEDEQVAALAMQIRATIAKVRNVLSCIDGNKYMYCAVSHVCLNHYVSRQRTSLRRYVRDAEEALQKANREMKKWEQKRQDYLNRY